MHLLGCDANLHRHICLSSEDMSRMPAGLGSILPGVAISEPQRLLSAGLLPQSGLCLRYSGMKHLWEEQTNTSSIQLEGYQT